MLPHTAVRQDADTVELSTDLADLISADASSSPPELAEYHKDKESQSGLPAETFPVRSSPLLVSWQMEPPRPAKAPPMYSDSSWEYVYGRGEPSRSSRTESYQIVQSHDHSGRSSFSPLSDDRPATGSLRYKVIVPKTQRRVFAGHSRQEQTSARVANREILPITGTPPSRPETASVPQKTRKRGRLTDDGRDKAKIVRRMGACLRCRMYKIGVSEDSSPVCLLRESTNDISV